MATPVLSPEVWLNIFEWLDDAQYDTLPPPDWEGKRSTHALLPVVLTCKAWNCLAAPLLYRHVFFNYPPGAERFLRHLVQKEHAGEYPHHFCQTLTLSSWIDPDEADEPFNVDLSSILWQLPKLVSFKSVAYLTYRELAATASTTAHTLRELIVCVTANTLHSEIFLLSLQKLQQLQHLELEIAPAKPPRSLAHMAGLQLQFVQRLFIRISGSTREADPGPSLPYLEFLSRCHFPRLQHLRLADVGATDEAQQMLLHFMALHGARLWRFDWSHEQSWHYPHELLLQMTNTHHFGFFPTDLEISPTILSALPPYTRHLHLRFRPDPSLDVFNQFFEDVRLGERTAPLKVIHTGDKEGGFTWAELSSDDPRRAGHWMRVALQLRTVGISLVDADGHGLALEAPTDD